MKYIRTKDGSILSLNEFNYEKKYHWYSPNKKYLSRLNIGFTCWHWCFEDEYDLIPDVLGKIMVEKIKREECKFADTIEELCDEFVHITNIGNHILGHFWLPDSSDTVYAAIWTDKGLIYVAKMNEKGEFELL